jgi:hypothetical protein
MSHRPGENSFVTAQDYRDTDTLEVPEMVVHLEFIIEGIAYRVVRVGTGGFVVRFDC